MAARSSRAPAPDLLEAIVAATRHAVTAASERRPSDHVEAEASQRQPRGQAFRNQLVSPEGIRVIAECKRRSPSRGLLRPDYDPEAIATGYETAGASAVSVLTEPAFFDGGLGHLAKVRAAVEIPVLRKDFIVTEYQLLEARAAGADAVLLIVAALDDRDLQGLLDAARALDLAAVVEVHNELELSRAVGARANIVGVNNRNLRTLEVNLDASFRLVEQIPESAVAIAESGIRSGHDLVSLRSAGYDACLVGESLMTRPDPGAELRSMLDDTVHAARPKRRVS